MVTGAIAADARASRRPDLSVVIPSVNGPASLFECLDRLRGNVRSGVAIEILVVERCGDDVRRMLRERVPEAIVIPVDPGTPIPAMRAVAFRHARAEAVAVIEDHVYVPPDWARRLLDALDAGGDAIGGSVANAATSRIVDWAAFLCEYSHLLAPRAGVSGTLTGNNVVYRRAMLERHAGTGAEGQWEDHLHEAMRRDGARLICRPEIGVSHKMHYRIREYLAQRYLYARGYAGLRAADMRPVRRLVMTCCAPGLAPVLLGRIVARVLDSGRHRRELVRSLPLLALFVCAWAAGETVGYAAGPGDALSRIK